MFLVYQMKSTHSMSGWHIARLIKPFKETPEGADWRSKASINCQWNCTGMIHRAGGGGGVGWSWVLWFIHRGTLGRISSKCFLRHRVMVPAKSELSWPRSSHLSSLLSTPFPRHRNYRAEGKKETNHIHGPECRLPTAAGLSFEWTLKCWLLLGKAHANFWRNLKWL